MIAKWRCLKTETMGNTYYNGIGWFDFGLLLQLIKPFEVLSIFMITYYCTESDLSGPISDNIWCHFTLSTQHSMV